MMALFNWLRRRKLENALDRELQYHVERRAADFIQSGMPESEARRRASLELDGSVRVREEVRDVWLGRWIRDFAYDLRFSARSFLRTPSFTITAVLSLALGVGATTAIYSLVDQVLVRALPVHNPERLVLIDWNGDTASTNAFGSWNLLSYPICRRLEDQKEIFDGVFCRALTTVTLSTGSDSRPAVAEVVSGSYFPVLGVSALKGRVFRRDDGTPNANPSLVISYDFWQTQFGGSDDVIGRKVLINQHPMKVIGVAAQGFHGIDVGETPSVWIPASMSGQAIPKFDGYLNPRVRWMQVLGRLRPDISARRAEAGLRPWFKAMLQEDMRRTGFPNITAERRKRYLASSLTLTASPQGHSSLRRRMTQPLWFLFAVTIVLLTLACLNVAGLFLARGSAREREIGTRLALGASAGRLGRQLLADSLLIALAGGMVGIAAAPVLDRVLESAMTAFLPTDIGRSALHSSLDWRLLLFAAGISIAAGLVSGFAPALQAGRSSLTSSLKERGGSGAAGVRIRRMLVTAQIALTLILLTGAVLFVRTLSALMARGPGFVTSSLISFSIDPARSGYLPANTKRLLLRIEEAVQRSPVTQSVAIASFPLLTGGSWNDPMTIEAGRTITTDRDVNLNAVTPGFFYTLGAKLLAGRDFNNHDVRPEGEVGRRVAIVNEAFARRYFAGRNPLGARICEGAGPDSKPDVEIVGVVSSFSYRAIREDSEQAYFSLGETGASAFSSFYVRVKGTPEKAFETMRAIVREQDPSLPLMNLRTLDQQLNRSLSTERILATLSAGFGVLALLLSLVGLYGVMSFVVTQRTREIGIRLALGASRPTTLWLILRDAAAMVAAGVCIAVPFVWAFGRFVESQLYEVKATDARAIALAILVLAIASLCAALIPARRASVLNPTEALRFE